MARTLSELGRDRRQAVRALKKELRDTQVKLEKSERRLTSVLNRKTKVPEIQDLEDLTTEYLEAQKQFDKYTEKIGEAVTVFTLV